MHNVTMKGYIALVALAVAACSPSQEAEQCEALFVQHGSEMSFDGTALTLRGASPDLIFFCDRPERIAGHMTWPIFVGQVEKGANSFAVNPPNAAISVIDDKGGVTEVVVELHAKPTRQGDTVTFPTKIIDGSLPASGGRTILFIDPIGHPLSPGSVAGIHRRVRRRAVLGR